VEESLGAGVDLPGVGRDFDEVAVGIGEVEEDAAGAATSDAAKDGELVPVLVVVRGAGLEVIDDGAEFAGGGEVFVAAVELEEVPIVEGLGADGVGEVAAAIEADAEAGLSVFGGEGDKGFDDGGEFGKGIGLHEILSNFKLVRRHQHSAGLNTESVETIEKIFRKIW